MDSALEGVLYVDDPGCALDDEYPDHVEAQGVEVGFSFGEVLFGQGADGGLFAWGDGLERVSEAQSAAELHFDNDEGMFPAQDQVQLPVTGTVVPFDELVSPPHQVLQRELLAPGAGETFAQGLTPA